MENNGVLVQSVSHRYNKFSFDLLLPYLEDVKMEF